MLGFVLIVVGISLMVILGADIQARGSRTTIERAFAVSRAIEIGRLAIDEACRSPGLRVRIHDQIVARIRAMPGFDASLSDQEALYAFIRRVAPTLPPAAPGAEPTLVVHPEPGREDPEEIVPGSHVAWIPGLKNNTVALGTGDPAVVPAADLKALHKAYEDELDRSRTLEVSDVVLRPVLYGWDGTEVTGGEYGSGLVRAQVRVRFRYAGMKQWVSRRVTVDRFFSLFQDRPEPERRIWCHKDPWQTEALNPDGL